MVENVIQIKSEIIIDVDVSVKNIIHVKKNYIWNLLHVAATMVDIKQRLHVMQL